MLTRMVVATACAAGLLGGCTSGHRAPAQQRPRLATVTTLLAADGLPAHIESQQAQRGVVPAARADQEVQARLPSGFRIDRTELAEVRNVATGHHGLCWLVIASGPAHTIPVGRTAARLPGGRTGSTISVTILDAPTGFVLFTIS